MSAEGQTSVVSLVQQVAHPPVKRCGFALRMIHTAAAQSRKHYQGRAFCKVEFTAGENYIFE
jgi:hypothetical protein